MNWTDKNWDNKIKAKLYGAKADPPPGAFEHIIAQLPKSTPIWQKASSMLFFYMAIVSIGLYFSLLKFGNEPQPLMAFAPKEISSVESESAPELRKVQDVHAFNDHVSLQGSDQNITDHSNTKRSKIANTKNGTSSYAASSKVSTLENSVNNNQINSRNTLLASPNGYLLEEKSNGLFAVNPVPVRLQLFDTIAKRSEARKVSQKLPQGMDYFCHDYWRIGMRFAPHIVSKHISPKTGDDISLRQLSNKNGFNRQRLAFTIGIEFRKEADRQFQWFVSPFLGYRGERNSFLIQPPSEVATSVTTSDNGVTTYNLDNSLREVDIITATTFAGLQGGLQVSFSEQFKKRYGASFSMAAFGEHTSIRSEGNQEEGWLNVDGSETNLAGFVEIGFYQDRCISNGTIVSIQPFFRYYPTSIQTSLYDSKQSSVGISVSLLK